jgi:hypothetical protein
MDQLDEQAHNATMHADGTDRRGQGGARATIVSTLAPLEGRGTRVDVVTEYHITGRLARFGRGGMIEDISERLLRQFAECLQASLGGDGAGGPGLGEGEPEVAGAPPAPDAPPTPDAPPAPETPPAPPTPQPAESLDALALARDVLWDRFRRNPAPVATVFGFVLALVLLRRSRR